jgi:hypothetical protein
MEAMGRFAQLEGAAQLVARFDVEFARVQDALTSVVART